MASAWFYQAMGKQIGPVSDVELWNLAQCGTITFETPIANAPNGPWVSAARIKGLFAAANEMPPLALTKGTVQVPSHDAEIPPNVQIDYFLKSIAFLQNASADSHTHAIEILRQFGDDFRMEIDSFSGSHSLIEIENLVVELTRVPDVMRSFFDRTPTVRPMEAKALQAIKDMVCGYYRQLHTSIGQVEPKSAEMQRLLKLVCEAEEDMYPVRKCVDDKWVSAQISQKPSQPFATDLQPNLVATPSGESSQLTAIGNIEAICPYCGNRLDRKPGRKKKCPHCDNFIHVRTRPLDNQKVLVTEKQMEAINEQWATTSPECILVEAQLPAVRTPPTKAASSQAAPMIQESSTRVQESVRDVILQTPEEITRYVVSRFARVSERTIADLSLEILRVQPHSPEIHLLYALRVSKCIPTLKAVSTLASRWSIANRGPQGNSGLQNGRQSGDWELVNRFLTNLYLQRFHELCEEVASKADETAAKRKTPTAKESAYRKAIDKILGAVTEFAENLPGLHEAKTQWIDRLEGSSKGGC